MPPRGPNQEKEKAKAIASFAENQGTPTESVQMQAKDHSVTSADNQGALPEIVPKDQILLKQL